MIAMYLIQQSEFLGHAQRGWGFGKVASYSKWRTVAKGMSEALAHSEFDRISRKPGLFRLRLMYRGKELARAR